MNWIKFWPVYLLVSGIALAFSLYSIVIWGFKYSIDFTGGSAVEYQFESQTTPQVLKVIVVTKHPEYKVEQFTVLGEKNIQLHFDSKFSQNNAEALRVAFSESMNQQAKIVRFETVGPTLSQEILKKTYIAVGVAALTILLWVALQFKSFKLGTMALVAVVHDLAVLLGVFAYLGHSEGVEVDILFVTALLMVFSLSLYDTIVVYDRIRESSKRLSGHDMESIANNSISETIVRSLNTSITTSLVLFALFLMGGISIKWFALALLVGIVSGTYSSPFVAVPLLVLWDKLLSLTKK